MAVRRDYMTGGDWLLGSSYCVCIHIYLIIWVNEWVPGEEESRRGDWNAWKMFTKKQREEMKNDEIEIEIPNQTSIVE